MATLDVGVVPVLENVVVYVTIVPGLGVVVEAVIVIVSAGGAAKTWIPLICALLVPPAGAVQVVGEARDAVEQKAM